MSQVAQVHEAFDEIELAAAIGLFDLTIEEGACDLPTYPAGGGIGKPLTEVGGDRIKVEVINLEAIRCLIRCMPANNFQR